MANSSFEDLTWGVPQKWILSGWHDSDQVHVDNTMSLVGKRSLLIDHREPNDTYISQYVSVDPKSLYRITGWIRVEADEMPQEGINASLGAYGTWVKTEPLKEMSQWIYRELWVRTAKDQHRLLVTCRLGFWSNAMKGKAWFDDLQVAKASQQPPNTVVHEIQETSIASNLTNRGILFSRGSSLLLILIVALFILRLLLSKMRSFSGNTEAVLVFLVVGFLYAVSSHFACGGPFRQSAYPHYAHQASAFSHGKLSVEHDYHEIVTYNGKKHTVVPVFPALLMTPFAFLFGENLWDVLFLVLVGSCNAAFFYALLPKIQTKADTPNLTSSDAFWLTVLYAFGTANWYLSIGGRVWHTEQIVAEWSLLLALHQMLGRGRPWLIGLFLGWGFLSHPPIVFSVIFFILVLAHESFQKEGKSLFAVAKALFPLAAVLGLEIVIGWGLYNYLRFDNFFEAGQSVLHSRFISEGGRMLSYTNIPSHIHYAFFRLPHFQGTPPFTAGDGFSFFLASPALLLIFLSFRKNNVVLSSWVSAIAVLLFFFHWFGNGNTQFGYRFSADALPFLMILTVAGLNRIKGFLFPSLVGFSILMNLAGVVVFYRYW